MLYWYLLIVYAKQVKKIIEMKKIYIIYAVLKDTEQTYQIVFVINVKYI